jgi:hypothetical protein
MFDFEDDLLFMLCSAMLVLLADNVFYKRVVNTSESSAPPTLINHLKSFYYASTLCPLSTIK